MDGERTASRCHTASERVVRQPANSAYITRVRRASVVVSSIPTEQPVFGGRANLWQPIRRRAETPKLDLPGPRTILPVHLDPRGGRPLRVEGKGVGDFAGADRVVTPALPLETPGVSHTRRCGRVFLVVNRGGGGTQELLRTLGILAQSLPRESRTMAPRVHRRTRSCRLP
jgi:hypothetical protein